MSREAASATGKKVLLAVERAHRGRYCAGQWKDIESLGRNLAGLGLSFELLEFDLAHMTALGESCAALGATDIVVHYSFFPEVLDMLARVLPRAKLYVRTVNAEAYQHWHRSQVRFLPTYGNARAVYGTLRLVWRDALCKRRAHAMLGISEWDNRHYWRLLPGRAKVHDVPYCSPWPILRPQVVAREWSARRNEVLCLAGGRDPIGMRMLAGFNALAEHAARSEAFRDWRFRLSPGVHAGGVDEEVPPRVERIARLDEPWDLLCEVRALAVLTPLGFGCKTTIIDALTAGCHVLVHPVLARRLSAEVRAACIEYDPAHPASAAELADRLSGRPAGAEAVRAVQGRAAAGLRQALLGRADAPVPSS